MNAPHTLLHTNQLHVNKQTFGCLAHERDAHAHKVSSWQAIGMLDSVGTQNESHYRDVLQTWIAKSASSWCANDLL